MRNNNLASRLSITVQAYLDLLCTTFRILWRRKRAETTIGPIVILCTAYPPATTGGVYRPKSLVDYLAKQSENVVVVTQTPDESKTRDQEAKAISPNGIKVIRLPKTEDRTIIGLFPRTDGNLADAYHNFHTLINQFTNEPKPSVVLSTGPKFDNFTLGRLLATYYDIPLILDYRDEWSDSPFEWVENRFFDRLMEWRALKRSTGAIFVTNSILDNNKQSFGLNIDRRMIPNGVDEEIFKIHKPTNKACAHQDIKDNITMSYIGSIGTHLDPTQFIEFINQAKLMCKELSSIMTVNMYGRTTERIMSAINRSTVCDIISMRPAVPQASVPELYDNADALLLIYPEIMRRYIPGKFYEYMATNRPIVVIGAAGEVPRIIEKTEAGFIVPWSEPDKLIKAVYDIHSDRTQHWSNSKRYNWISTHTRTRSSQLIYRMIIDSLRDT